MSDIAVGWVLVPVELFGCCDCGCWVLALLLFDCGG